MKTANEKNTTIHRSVLLAETLDLLNLKVDGTYLDATLGLGGHSEAVLQSCDCRIIGLDQDLEAIEFAAKRLEKFGERVKIIHANFAEIKQVLKKIEIEQVDGILADLGVSSLQLDKIERGFSFRADAPLDMRMNADSEDDTAAELLERLSEEEIANVIYNNGEERFSRRIARKIVERRKQNKPIQTTLELAEIVKSCVPKSRKDKIHPATRTFQALRIAVNREIEILENFLRDAVDCLKKDGRLVVISFHSIEDRIVKRTLQNLSGRCFCPPKFPQCVCGAKEKVEILTRKPLVPSEHEQTENPRSRSAKLRACQKIK